MVLIIALCALFIIVVFVDQISKSSEPEPTIIEGLLKSDIPLESDFNVNYEPLRDLLAAHEWKEANDETNKLMAQAVHCIVYKENGLLERGIIRSETGRLNRVVLAFFPLKDLVTIDHLWLKYSRGHFGFTVQMQIWFQMKGDLYVRPREDISGSDFHEMDKSPDFHDVIYKWSDFMGRIGHADRIAHTGHSKLSSEKYRQQQYKNLNFSLNAVKGHLPALGGVTVSEEWDEVGQIREDEYTIGGIIVYLFEGLRWSTSDRPVRRN
jgi:hypothetical protein